jgi:membrane-associated phospholipid phosphatase
MTETSDTGRDPVNPPREELLAERLTAKPGPAGPARAGVVAAMSALSRIDRACYAAVARLPPSQLDVPLRRLAKFADFSKPWFIVATLLALFGGSRGRRAAITGIAAIGVTSFAVNQPMKLVSARTRPDRDRAGVPQERWVSMPESTSFPSGHSASAAAFATAVGDVIPAAGIPLRVAAALVAFTRVYTGVHYPSDVVIGATAGALFGRLTSLAAQRIGRTS